MLKAIVCALALLAIGPAAAQDVFLFNAKGYTLQNGVVTAFDSLLVKDGKVQAAGPESLLRPYAAGKVERDLGGKSILPGMVDAHTALGDAACDDDAGRKDCVAQALLKMASRGVTLALDGGIDPDLWDALRLLEIEKAMPIRVHGAIAGLGEAYDALGQNGPNIGTYEGTLTLRAISLVQGSSAPGQSCQTAKVAVENPVALRNRIARGMMRGYQMRAAAVGDGAITETLAAYQDIADIAGTGRRHQLFVHGVPKASAADGFVATGTLALVSPCLEDRSVAAVQAADFVKLAAGEVQLAVRAPGPFAALQALSTGLDDPNAAFAALTFGGAYAAFADYHLGSLESGKWADFLIVDQDIFTVPQARIGETTVLETWVAGRQVFSASD